MHRKILAAAVIVTAALTPSVAEAGGLRAADVKACKAQRKAMGKHAFRATHRSIGSCANARGSDRAAARRAAANRVVAPPAAPAEAPAAPAADVAPVVEPAAPVAAESVAAEGVHEGGKPAWANPGKGKAKGHANRTD